MFIYERIDCVSPTHANVTELSRKIHPTDNQDSEAYCSDSRPNWNWILTPTPTTLNRPFTADVIAFRRRSPLSTNNLRNAIQ